jgi:hypothetical protein
LFRSSEKVTAAKIGFGSDRREIAARMFAVAMVTTGKRLPEHLARPHV